MSMLSSISCPSCNEYDYHRSRPKNVFEIIRIYLLRQKTYRCHNCNYRGWVKIKEISPEVGKRGLSFYFYILIISIILGVIIGSSIN